MWRYAVQRASPAAAVSTLAAGGWVVSRQPSTDDKSSNSNDPKDPTWKLPFPSTLAASACLLFSRFPVAQCEPAPDHNNIPEVTADSAPADIEDDKDAVVEEEEEEAPVKRHGFQPDAVGDYHGLFPARQLWKPAVEYPLWDMDWDGKHPPSTGDEVADKQKLREIRKNGVTRHIICIRHGQYDETHKEDGKRVLTPLGRTQAALTGQRLAALLDTDFPIRSVKVSNMTRAKETAAIITTYLSGVQLSDPDPMLNEGRPCHHIPGGKASSKTIQTTDDNHPRIEEAFEKYFHRADYDEKAVSDKDEQEKDDADTPHHEVEIIVCHANVIRYFLCRALQLPPEAWLRYCPFNCSLTYFTIRPTGTVSCRMVGDIGHLPYEATTFSMHEGFLW